MKKYFLLSLAFLLSLSLQAQQFKISYTDAAFKGPFTGKVYVYLNKNNRQPKDGEVGIDFFPLFAVSVNNIKPGASITVDDNATSFPMPLSGIERGTYFIQAV